LTPSHLASPVAQARLAWLARARPSQLPPTDRDWATWFIRSGRGWGKTRTGAEWLAWEAQKAPGTRWAVVAPTFADARDTCVEGQSGLLSVIPPSEVASWNRSIGEMTLANGSRIKLFSADAPSRLRGPQHSGSWCDELATWPDPDAWDQLMFGLRLGSRPRVVVTTTPRPTALVRGILADADTVVTTGSTFENEANLAPSAVATLRRKYEGTRLGRQELEGEVLEDMPGALWTMAMIDAARVTVAPEMQRIVVAVDPSGQGDDGHGDSIGIVVAGLGVDGRGYILADRSCDMSPAGWGARAVDAYREFNADRIVAERNFGGAMVEHVIRTVDRNVSYSEVTASRGKVARAEPVAALYEQGRVSHMGVFAGLEDQMCAMGPSGYAGKGSPDRLDAAVWALTDLMLGVQFAHEFA